MDYTPFRNELQDLRTENRRLLGMIESQRARLLEVEREQVALKNRVHAEMAAMRKALMELGGSRVASGVVVEDPPRVGSKPRRRGIEARVPAEVLPGEQGSAETEFDPEAEALSAYRCQ